MVNDLVIKMANVNGTGSASANTIVAKAFFRMGVSMCAKNLFPSNIQGLPTWYVVRVSDRQHISFSERVDLLVAMNPQSYAEDIQEVRTGGYVLYDSSWPLNPELKRSDLQFMGIPLAALAVEHFKGRKSNLHMKNVLYLGAIVALLNIDYEIVVTLIKETYKKTEDNLKALKLGFDYAHTHFSVLPFHLNRHGHHGPEKLLMTGNTAAAMGALAAGATVAAWYPITPSTSIMEAFESLCEKYRKDSDGKKKFCVIQAEDEMSAIGTVIGGAWVGARSFTCTSGPGVSLMNELLGFAYYAEIPAVLIDVQRVGPSTGLPTRTQQSDLLTCAFASHGDTCHLLLFPADPRECFLFARLAFDLADRYQTPVIVLSDLDVGMNEWVIDSLPLTPYVPDRGKVFKDKSNKFFRYKDIDGDGICYRTFPGQAPELAYFTRGSGHNALGGYTEKGSEYSEVLDRLKKKFETAAKHMPLPVLRKRGGADTVIVGYGSSDPAISEAIELLAEKGILVNYLRICSFPFSPEVKESLLVHKNMFVVEQNRDGQMASLIALATGISRDKFHLVLHYDGLPLSGERVAKEIQKGMGRL